MKYDERTCKFNMDTGCVELLLRDGRKISIDCTGVEDALDVTMAQRSYGSNVRAGCACRMTRWRAIAGQSAST